MASSSCEIEIFHAPKAIRFGEDEPEEPDEVIVLSCGEMIRYVIPSFDVFTIPLRPLKIEGYSTEADNEDEVVLYDVFARNCPLLDRAYPATMLIKDVVIIKVN